MDRPHRIARSTVGLVTGVFLAALLCGSAAAAEPAGFVYAGGSSGVEALAVGADAQLTPVTGVAHGQPGAIALTMVHAANGLNVYELAPSGSPGLYAISHFTVDAVTGELTPVGAPFGSFRAYSFPSDLYGFDGFGRFEGKSELFLGACTAASPCAGKLFELAVNPADGSLSEDGAVEFGAHSVVSIAGFGDEIATATEQAGSGQNFLVSGAISHATGHVSWGAETDLVIGGVTPEPPCCGAAFPLALREHELVAAGDELGKPIKEKEFTVAYGVGFFETGAAVNLLKVTAFSEISAFRGLDNAPIAFAGNLVVAGVVDPPEPHGSALQLLDTAGDYIGEVPVNEFGGAVTSMLALGNQLYVGSEFGPIVQFGGVGGGTLTRLVPASPIGGPASVGAMTGFLKSELETPPGKGAGETPSGTGGSETPSGKGGGGTPGGGGGIPVTAAATLLRLALAPGSFKAASAGGSVMPSKVPAGKPRGTKVTFQLSAASTVGFTVVALLPGKQVKNGGKTSCVKTAGPTPKKRRCTRRVALSGNFSVAGAAGSSTFRFSGRLAGEKLAPGHYELRGAPVATGKAGAGAGRSAAFTVLG